MELHPKHLRYFDIVIRLLYYMCVYCIVYTVCILCVYVRIMWVYNIQVCSVAWLTIPWFLLWIMFAKFDFIFAMDSLCVSRFQAFLLTHRIKNTNILFYGKMHHFKCLPTGKSTENLLTYEKFKMTAEKI